MNTIQYIDKLKKINNLDTDYKLAKLLGCKQQKIKNWRDGQTMDNNTARQFAEMLEIPVWNVIADMEAERAKDEPTRKAWKMLSKMTKQSGRASAKLLISLGVLANSTAVLCILCKITNGRTVRVRGVSNYVV